MEGHAKVQGESHTKVTEKYLYGNTETIKAQNISILSVNLDLQQQSQGQINHRLRQ